MRLPIAFINFADQATQFVYRVTDGRIGGKQLKYSMLVLSTVGRKSGQARTHTLLYVRDGENMVVCASNNGHHQHPGWYWNLKANPQARVQAGRQRYKVIAEMAAGEEYARLWQKLLAVRPQYAEYRTRTTRVFPIVILKPAGTSLSDEKKAERQTRVDSTDLAGPFTILMTLVCLLIAPARTPLRCQAGLKNGKNPSIISPWWLKQPGIIKIADVDARIT